MAHEKYLESTNLSRDVLLEKFISVRGFTKKICSYLETEDYVVQPHAEVSPPKWHLAHTTWLFEETILSKYDNQYKLFSSGYGNLFNSYYKSCGDHWIQGERGHLSRPTVREIMEYRDYVDDALMKFFTHYKADNQVDFLLEIGLNHEQQHQELLLMDIKYILASNPSFPTYRQDSLTKSPDVPSEWQDFQEGVFEVGLLGSSFAYDNERPYHKTYLHPFSVRQNCVSNGEFLKFMQDGGYADSSKWLSEGWNWIHQENVRQPLYWIKKGDDWFEYTLHGLQALDLHAPVTHISYFEADAFANWSGYRLPTEFEMEIFLNGQSEDYENGMDHPHDCSKAVGQVWCWTRSHYSPYPGYRSFHGMLGEYNGKFMCNQFVLKGGCTATPKGHYRHSYRNFYQAHQRWMFSGLRLARDLTKENIR